MAHCRRALQAAVTFEYRQAVHVFHPVGDALIRLPDDAVLARLDLFHIDIYGAADGNAEIAAAPRHVGGAGACHQGFGRNATDVHACAAKQLALDDRRFQALLRHTLGHRRPGLTRTDDHRVKFCRHPKSPQFTRFGNLFSNKSRLIRCAFNCGHRVCLWRAKRGPSGGYAGIPDIRSPTGRQEAVQTLRLQMVAALAVIGDI